MRKPILEFLVAIALSLAAILTSAPGVMASDVMVSGGFARASATPMAKSGAAYVTIMNHGATGDRLLAIASPAAGHIMMHGTKEENGVMSMSMVDGVDLAAGATVKMEPGGLHIMLMDLKAPLIEGKTLSLELTFEKAGKLAVDVPIAGVAATQAP